MASSLQQIYRGLCSLAVFRGVNETPLFGRFATFAESTPDSPERMRAYAAFVEEIYASGANLADSVRRILFADENIYVKTIGLGKEVSPHVRDAAARELVFLSQFASLTPADFATFMPAYPVPATFDSDTVDLREEYALRLSDIGRHGYGMFTSSAMFSVTDEGEILPIVSADTISLDRFIGYEEERGRVLANTKAFLQGRPAANVLLYGDAGTGKSSSVKAIVNHLFEDGLRLIELRKNQLLLLPRVMEKIAHNPLKFIIFIDDLSFNKNDDSFSMLKATLEGSASAKAKNAVIYATSTRRHIVRECFSDREGNDVHRNDTVQETLSLSERFGMTVLFAKPEKRLYLEIIHELADRNGIDTPLADLDRDAEAFALKRGYRSARCAEQFIESLM